MFRNTSLPKVTLLLLLQHVATITSCLALTEHFRISERISNRLYPQQRFHGCGHTSKRFQVVRLGNVQCVCMILILKVKRARLSMPPDRIVYAVRVPARARARGQLARAPGRAGGGVRVERGRTARHGEGEHELLQVARKNVEAEASGKRLGAATAPQRKPRVANATLAGAHPRRHTGRGVIWP